MTLFDPRSALKAAALLCAVLAGPCVAFAAPGAASDAGLLDILDEIEGIQALHGDNSPDLVEPLTRLSLLYEERGDSTLALALIDQITHVMHVNYGLHSLDEAPLIQRSIRLEEARGNHEAAWAQEQELLVLARRHRDHPGAVPILHYMAEKRLEILARYKAGEFPPQIVLGCYYSAPNWSNCRAGSKSQVIASLRSEARRFYAEAASVLARREYLASLCTGPPPPQSIATPCP